MIPCTLARLLVAPLLVLWSVVVILPIPARAQSATTGAIAGVARDASGAVLPGVTVEASSAALIEKVRSVVTDDQGNYKIVELRPGVYSVTFTLPGFATYKREGIELTVGFTAAVNAEMRVGGVEETITVTGESPLVDVQNARTRTVLSREVLDTLPTFKTTGGFLAVTLGSAAPGSQDVGGNRGESIAGMSIHGSRTSDLRWKQDGMSWNSVLGSGNVRTHRQNTVGIQEVVVEAGGTPENETGGAQLNYIPRDGANVFSLYSVSTYSDEHLQAQNLTDELRARGLTATPGAKQIWDYGVGVGGPIFQDKLWFYQGNRWWGGSEYPPNAYFNMTVGSRIYTPDLSRPAFTSNWAQDFGGRVTWQAAAKHRFTFSDNVQRNCNCAAGSTNLVSPEAGTDSDNFWNQVIQSTWTYTASSKLLFMGGFSWVHLPQASHMVLGTTEDTIGIVDLGTGLRYNAKATSDLVSDYGENRRRDGFNQQLSASYVTGSHAFKTGVQFMQGLKDHNTYIPQSITYQFRNGSPSSLIEWQLPATVRPRVSSQAFYAQDQWTIKRVTLNYGVRFDAIQGWTLAENLPAGNPSPAIVCPQLTIAEGGCREVTITGRFVPARSFPQVDNVPNFKDLSPRVSVAYDLFGSGKTAIKASLHRYVGGLSVGLAESVHPELANGAVSTTTRTWSDSNGDFVPDCDLNNNGANGECGATNNSAFGTTVVNTSRTDDVTTGFGNREYSWMGSLGVQHEVRPGIAVNLTYYRTWFGNFTTTDNTLVTPSNFDPYCITAPVDSRLPNGGGNQVCGFYDIQRSSFGQVSNLITKSSHFGEQTSVYSSVDASLSARFGRGGFLAGGVSFSRESTRCVVVDSPQIAPVGVAGAAGGGAGFCDIAPPWSAGTQVKLNGAYPLPWDLEASAVFQNLPGIQDLANYAAPNALIAPSLGRNLAACTSPTGACNSTAAVGLVAPGTMYEDRLNQVDVRFAKIFRVGRGRLKGLFDIYNLFNASTVLSVNQTYAPPPAGSATNVTWLQPGTILGPRLFKFGVEINF